MNIEYIGNTNTIYANIHVEKISSVICCQIYKNVWPPTRANFLLLRRASVNFFFALCALFSFFVFAVFAHFRPFLCTVITLITFSSNLGSWFRFPSVKKTRSQHCYWKFYSVLDYAWVSTVPAGAGVS